MLRRKCETKNFETKKDCEMEVNKLTDALCKSLEDDTRKQHDPRHSHISAREAYREDKLERIVGPYGRMNLPATAKKKSRSSCEPEILCLQKVIEIRWVCEPCTNLLVLFYL